MRDAVFQLVAAACGVSVDGLAVESPVDGTESQLLNPFDKGAE